MSFQGRRIRDVLAVCLVSTSLLSVAAHERLTFEKDVRVVVRSRAQLDFWRPQEVVVDAGPTPEGRAIRLRGESGSGFAVSATPLADDWHKVESIGLWLHRSADEAKANPTSELVLRLAEENQKVHFWKRLEVSHVGWKKFLLPLEWFAWSDGRMPRWSNVRSMMVQLRDSGTVTLDTVWAEPSALPRAEFLEADRLTKFAFVERSNSDIRTLETRDVQLVTDAPALELERLATHLSAVAKRLHQELPSLTKPKRGAVLFVFQKPADYRQFAPRVARQFQSPLDPPKSNGYTLQGVSSSWWDEKQGSLRPVYTHEFVHSYLSRTLPLSTSGDWFQEGLAAHIQLEFHPEDLSQRIREGLKSSHASLAELCDGHRIDTQEYWQAALLWKLFVSDPRFQAKLPELIERLAIANSTNLSPHLEPLWGTDFRALTDDWRELCEQLVRQ